MIRRQRRAVVQAEIIVIAIWPSSGSNPNECTCHELEGSTWPFVLVTIVYALVTTIINLPFVQHDWLWRIQSIATLPWSCREQYHNCQHVFWVLLVLRFRKRGLCVCPEKWSQQSAVIPMYVIAKNFPVESATSFSYALRVSASCIPSPCSLCQCRKLSACNRYHYLTKMTENVFTPCGNDCSCL